MAEEEPEKMEGHPKRHRHLLRNLVLLASLLLLSVYLALFFSFNYFGERFLREVLQKEIHRASNGLYNVDFRKMQFNIFTGKINIDSFELVPDTHLYNQMKSKGKVTKSLYRVSFESLNIDRIHFWQIYNHQQVTLRNLLFERPVLSIVGFPDTTTAKKARWKVIYEDIYPLVSEVFRDFHIDSVNVNHGLLLTSFRQKTGKLSTGEYEFSAILRDVSVNPFSYYNRERVFYSRDIDWKVHNFEYIMADSLYFLSAGEIGFSLAKSKLYGKDLSLRPNFALRGLHARPRGDFYKFSLPAFSVEGVDLYRALTDKKVRIQNLELNKFSMTVYRNLLSGEIRDPGKAKKKREKFKIAGMFTVIAGIIRSIEVDTLTIKQASFAYYSRLNDVNPEVRIGSADLGLNGFLLDSVAHLDKQKIFYADKIELLLSNFNLKLRDQVHSLSAGRVKISTEHSHIVVNDALLSPDIKRNLMLPGGARNTIYLLLPQVTFSRINLVKLFNHRVFDFDRLEISEPDLKVTRHRAPKNKDPRFRKPGDFFAEENEEVVYDLLKKYVYVIRGNAILIQNGHGTIARQQDSIEKVIASAHLDLEMQQFLIDSAHGMNQQGYFYSRDFALNLRSVAVESPDGMRHMTIGQVKVITADSLIEAENISIDKTSGPDHIFASPGGRPALDFAFTLTKLRLTGLNHRKLFLEQVLKANVILLEKPVVRLKTEANLIPDGPSEETRLIGARKFIRDFEIGRLIVKQGAFSYDGLENRQATYFSLKDIDFGLLNARVHVPEKGKKDGLISFDSLQLKIFPFRAVIADSNYVIECRELDVHSYPADITFRGLKLIPLREPAQMKGKRLTASAVIPELKITGFYFDKAIFDNEWRVDRIRIYRPKIRLEILKNESGPKLRMQAGHPYTLQLPPFIKTLSIQSVTVDGADAEARIIDKEKTLTYSLQEIFCQATSVLVDSATRANPLTTPLFNTANIVFSAAGLTRVLKDSMYSLSFSRFGFSTKAGTAFIDSMAIIPNYGREEFSRKLGYQADRTEISVPRIDLQTLNFHKLLDSGVIDVGTLKIRGLVFASYRDKRVILPPGPTPLMPQQMIRRITFPVCIDTILIDGAQAAYEEQTGPEPGRLFFDKMDVRVTGFNTLKSGATSSSTRSLNVNGTAFLMGKSKVEAGFWFPIDHPRDSFTLRAVIGMLDLRDLNPMLTKLLPVSVTRGVAGKTTIRHLHANDSISRGFMDMKFSGLKIHLDDTDPGAANKIEKALLTGVANYLLPDNNPRDDGRMRTGVIYFQRDKSKGFFNFVWKSTLSGIKSSAGFNSKIQRQIRRAEKNMKQ